MDLFVRVDRDSGSDRCDQSGCFNQSTTPSQRLSLKSPRFVCQALNTDGAASETAALFSSSSIPQASGSTDLDSFYLRANRLKRCIRAIFGATWMFSQPAQSTEWPAEVAEVPQQILRRSEIKRPVSGGKTNFIQGHQQETMLPLCTLPFTKEHKASHRKGLALNAVEILSEANTEGVVQLSVGRIHPSTLVLI